MIENMKHTPGPWHWDSDPVKGDPTGRIRYRVTTTGKTITQVYYSSFEGGLTNAEADAKLIAAAPELLEALKECMHLMMQNFGSNDKKLAHQKAKAAIDKATRRAAP